MKWLLNQARTCDWLTPPSLMAKWEEPYEWKEKMQRNIVACLLISTNLQRIKEGGRLDPVNNYKLRDYMDDAIHSIFEATYKGKALDATERNLQASAIGVMVNYSGLKPKEQKASSSKSLSIVDEFAMTLAESTVPQLPCGLAHLETAADPDEARSFLRILLNQTALPVTEMQPMMTARLKEIMNLYKTKRASASDADTRDFYDYQILAIGKILKND